MSEFSKTRYVAGVISLVILSFIIGVNVGFNHRTEIEKVTGISNKETPSDISETDFTSFWKTWNIINEKYPDQTSTTSQDKVYGAISGLMGSLKDPYSMFFTPDETKLFQDEIAGSFGGIGAEIDMRDGVLTVIAPLKDSPAYRAGIKPGDKIIKIDKNNLSDLNFTKALKLIRGERGTTVTLTVLHEGEKETKEIQIVRDIINLPTLDTELRPDGIFVIKLYSFSANSSSLFRNALKEFAKSKTDKLLLDLRGNPGGYLDMAVNISSWFLPEGKTVVTEDYGHKKDSDVYRSKGYVVSLGNNNVLDDKLKFVILIDGGSASASEIVAGTMQDHKKAILVGSHSFGKGSVQEVVKITPDTILKITVAKWLTPNGNLIAEKGLTPDYKVALTQKDADAKKDPQLDKAVQLLNNWPGIK